MNKKLIFLLAIASAIIIPATANAQWADPAGFGDKPKVVFNYVAPTSTQPVEIPAKVEGSATVEAPAPVVVSANPATDVRPPKPCNPIDVLDPCNGNHLPPGTVVTPPGRSGAMNICNPFDYGDPCNGYNIPVGVTVTPPPRPDIPCTIFTEQHCTDADALALEAGRVADIAAGRAPRVWLN